MRKKKTPPALAVCDALATRGISDPDSQEAIRFCVERCPYSDCIAVERSLKPSPQRTDRERALEMARAGVPIAEIAARLHVSERTVHRWRKEIDA